MINLFISPSHPVSYPLSQEIRDVVNNTLSSLEVKSTWYGKTVFHAKLSQEKIVKITKKQLAEEALQMKISNHCKRELNAILERSAELTVFQRIARAVSKFFGKIFCYNSINDPVKRFKDPQSNELLFNAIKNKNVKDLKRILGNSNLPLEIIENGFKEDNGDCTPVLLLTEDYNTLKFLLERGADPNQYKISNGYKTSLPLIEFRKDHKLIKLLGKFRVNPNLTSYPYKTVGWTALMYARNDYYFLAGEYNEGEDSKQNIKALKEIQNNYSY